MRLQQLKISKHKDLFLRFSMAGVRGVPGEGGKAGSDLAAVFSKSRNKTLQQNATRSLQALGRLNTFSAPGG